MSHVKRKSMLCISEKKDPDQLGSNCTADQPLCFRYTHCTIPLLPKFEISSLQLSSVVVLHSFCGTWSETGALVSGVAAYISESEKSSIQLSDIFFIENASSVC